MIIWTSDLLNFILECSPTEFTIDPISPFYIFAELTAGVAVVADVAISMSQRVTPG